MVFKFVFLRRNTKAFEIRVFELELSNIVFCARAVEIRVLQKLSRVVFLSFNCVINVAIGLRNFYAIS